MNSYVGSSFGAKGSSGNSRCTFPISVSLSGKAPAPLDHMPIPQLATFLSVTQSISFICMTYLACIILLDMQLLC